MDFILYVFPSALVLNYFFVSFVLWYRCHWCRMLWLLLPFGSSVYCSAVGIFTLQGGLVGNWYWQKNFYFHLPIALRSGSIVGSGIFTINGMKWACLLSLWTPTILPPGVILHFGFYSWFVLAYTCLYISLLDLSRYNSLHDFGC